MGSLQSKTQLHIVPHWFCLSTAPFGSLWSHSCAHTHSRTRNFQLLGLWFIFNCKDTKHNTTLSFSGLSFAAELLYGISFMVLCHVFFTPEEPCEHCTQKHCRFLRDSKMLELKVISSRELKWSSKTFSQGPTGMTGADQCPIYSHTWGQLQAPGVCIIHTFRGTGIMSYICSALGGSPMPERE